MALLVYPKRSLQKPSLARLNRGHNIARGMLHYFPILEQIPYQYKDYVTGLVSTVTGAFSFGNNPVGYGAGGIVADNRDRLGFSTLVKFPLQIGGLTEFTAAALFYYGPSATSVTRGNLFNSRNYQGNAFSCELIPNNSGTDLMRIIVGDGISYQAYADVPTATLQLDAWRTVFFTGKSGSALNIYTGLWPQARIENMDSVLTGGRTGTWTMPADEVEMFGWPASGTQYGNAYSWAGLWNRRLDMAEMQALHEAPWQMLEIPVIRRYVFMQPPAGFSLITHAYTVTGVEDSGGLSASKTTGTFTSSVGDCIVVVAAIYKNGPHAWNSTTPIDDSKANTWHPIGSEFNPGGGNQIVRKYYSIITNAGSGHTISIYSDTATQFVMLVEAFTPTDTVTVLDGTPVDTAVTSNTTTFVPGSGVTTTNPGSVVIGWIVTNNSVSLTADSPQTKGSFVSGTGWYGGGISYDIKSATGTFTPSWTTGSDQGTVGVFAILPASSGGGITPTPVVSGESLGLGMTESRTIVVSQTRDDSIKVGMTEDRVILVNQTRNDSLTIGLTDVSATRAQFSSADSLAAGLSDASNPVRAQWNRDDTLGMGFTEDRTLAVTLNRNDSLTAGLTDASAAILTTLQRDDSLAVIVQEDRTILVTVRRDDSLAVVINESSAIVDLLSGLVTKSSSDTLSVSLTEDSGPIRVAVSTGENLPAGLLDATQQLLAAVNSADVLATGVSEDSGPVRVSINSTSESLSITISDASGAINVLVSTGDTLGLNLTDLSNAIAVAVNTQDSLLAGVQEASDKILVSIANTSESFPLVLIDASQVQASFSSADIIGLRLTESGIVAASAEFLGNTLVATLMLLSPIRTMLARVTRRTVTCLTPIRTLRVI